MSNLPTCRRISLLLLCVAFTTWGCTETRLVEPDPASEPEPSTIERGVLLGCVVAGDPPTMSCRPEDPNPSDEILASLHLGTPYVDLRSPSVSFIAAIQTLVADVRLINTSGHTIGDEAPSLAWFFTGPTVTDGSGTVTVDNPDGTDTFVDSEPRPFFQYTEVLPPGDSSATKQWGFKYDGVVNAFEFSVFVQVDVADESAPFIGQISPSILEPGEAATISGFNFSATPEDNQVTVDGQPATVTDATTTELTIEVPALPATECSVDDVAVDVEVQSHPAATQSHQAVRGNPNTLSGLTVGDFANLFETGDVACGVELPVNDGEEYFLSVHNASTDRTVEIGLQLTGSMPGAGGAIAPPISFAIEPQPRVLSPAERQQLAELQAHIDQLERNRELANRLGPRSPVQAAAAPPPSLGDTDTFFAPRGGFTVDAEVVYVGDNVVVWEDQSHPRLGEIDGILDDMGQEYDDRMHGLLTTYFGDPLAMDAQLDDNGVIYIVIVRPEATIAPGVVRTCDFASLSDCSTSNEAEIAWLRSPSGSDNLTAYSRSVRPTVMHETKHVTAIAEDLSQGQPLEDVALEEATASLSEELWGWDVHGRTQSSNLQWEDEPDCFEPFASAPAGCAEPVSGTQGLFVQLYDRLLEWEGNGQFGSPAWYYVYWWFVRWSVDHSGTDQATFLKSLVNEGSLLGIDNLADKMGRSFPELFGEFTIATMIDDLDGFSPSGSAPETLDHPSWDSRDIFLAIKGTASSRTEDFPIVPTEVNSGSFAATIESLEAASANIFELTATNSGTQTLRLRNVDGDGPADPLIRMSIIRVQ